MPLPTLRTKRLNLRPFILEDAPVVHRLASDFEVADTTLNIPHPYPDDAAEGWILGQPESCADGSCFTWAITLCDTSELCGSISLGITPRFNTAKMGCWLGRPYWSNGYATEAAKAVLDHGFSHLRLHKIHARHFSRNPASGRVLQKIGMAHEGCQREHVRRGDRYEDVHNYGILSRLHSEAGDLKPVALRVGAVAKVDPVER